MQFIYNLLLGTYLRFVSADLLRATADRVRTGWSIVVGGANMYYLHLQIINEIVAMPNNSVI